MSRAAEADLEKLPDKAIALPLGQAMSMFHAASYPAAFTEFLYGDACPFLERKVPLMVQEIFSSLLNREELEYKMPSDSTPFVAPRNRFDTSEFCCFFGDTLRRMRTLQSVRAAFDRPGFQRDLHLISNLTADDFLQASRPDIAKTNMSEGRLRAPQSLATLAICHRTGANDKWVQDEIEACWT